jgi:PAS domain S-box-containing protein
VSEATGVVPWPGGDEGDGVHALIEVMPALVWTATADGRFLSLNRRWREYAGPAARDLDGALHPDDAGRWRERWIVAVERRAELQGECRLRRADGAWRWHMLRVSPLAGADPGGRWIGTAMDIDDARRAAVAAEDARLYAEAERAARARDDFLCIAGHELRSPLTALQLQVQAVERLARREGPSPIAARLETTRRYLRRLDRLVEELLDASRIGTGRLVLRRERIELGRLAWEVSARFAEQMAAAGCALRLDAPRAVVGCWDRARVEQILTNLLLNAVKYGRGEPIVITVGCDPRRADPRKARLAVRDHGIGIAPEHQQRVFERCERAVSERHYGGLGLGLWIARQMAERMGGTIRLASEPGRGATFEVELPIAPRRAPGPVPDPGGGG